MTKAETALAEVLAEVLKANARMKRKLKERKERKRTRPIIIIGFRDDDFDPFDDSEDHPHAQF